MRKTSTKVLAATLTAAMMLAGCGGQQAAKPAETKAQTEAPAADAKTEAQTEAPAADAKTEVATETAVDWKPDLNTITFRVANAAGGNADLQTRLIAKAVQDKTGTTAVVQNITGSSGFLMATDLDSYDPSPCELMLGTEALFTIAPLFNENVKISLDDYEILYGSDGTTAPSMLAVPATLGIKTWDEFIEYAKSNRIIVASNTPGGLTHLQTTALMGAAGIEFTSVTDSGGNKNILSCLNGDANCVMVNRAALESYVDSEQLVPLVQFNSTEYDWGKYGKVPSVDDFGYNISLESCSIMCVRKGADEAGVSAMRAIIENYLNSDQGKADMKEIQSEMVVMDADSARTRLEKEVETMKRLKETYYK